MSGLVSDVIEIGSFGLIKDPLGIDAGKDAAREAAGLQASAAELGVEESRRQFDITERRLTEADKFARAQQQPFQQAGVRALEQQDQFNRAGASALQQQRILLGLGSGEEERLRSGERSKLEGEISDIEGAPRVFQFGDKGRREAEIAGITGEIEGLEGRTFGSGLSAEQEQEQAFAKLQESPGQQFLRKRQERALLRNASAIGGLGGGNVRTALQEQAVGFAQQDLQNQFGRLGQIAGQGRASTSALVAGGQGAAGASGQGALGTASSIGQFGRANVANINQARQSAAEARASGILGAQQAESQATGQILQLGGQFAGALI